jgi:nucleotide-binding universal stress UspA family protein
MAIEKEKRVLSIEKYCPVTAVKRLLLTTDGSPHSEGAVREALQLAKRCSSALHVITVQPGKETRDAKVGGILKAVKDAALEEGIECHTKMAYGDAADEILKKAASKRVDLIIMGRRGLKWLAKTLKGSVVSKVMGHVHCNVLVVPQQAQIGRKPVLVATDGSAYGHAASIAAIFFAKQCGSRLIALSAMRSEGDRAAAEANVNRVVEQARLDGVVVETLTPVGKPYDAIVEAAKGYDVGLIAIGGFGKTAPRRFLTGSIVEKVVGRAGCAVLVVKAER